MALTQSRSLDWRWIGIGAAIMFGLNILAGLLLIPLLGGAAPAVEPGSVAQPAVSLGWGSDARPRGARARRRRRPNRLGRSQRAAAPARSPPRRTQRRGNRATGRLQGDHGQHSDTL